MSKGMYREQRTLAQRAVDLWIMSQARGRPVYLESARRAVGLEFWPEKFARNALEPKARNGGRMS